MSLKTVLVLDLACMAFFLMLALLFPQIRYSMAVSFATFFLFLLLHALIVPFKGLDFVLWDAPPDSPVKYYWFIAIFIAIGGGLKLAQAVWVYFEWS